MIMGGGKLNDIQSWFLTLYKITLKIRSNIHKLQSLYLCLYAPLTAGEDWTPWALNPLCPVAGSLLPLGKLLNFWPFWLWTVSLFCVTFAATFIASMRYSYKLNNEIIVSIINVCIPSQPQTFEALNRLILFPWAGSDKRKEMNVLRVWEIKPRQ